MSLLFTAASLQYLTGAAPTSGLPMTMAAWIRPTSFATTQVAMAIGDSAASGRTQLSISTAGVLTATTVGSTSGSANATAGTLVAGTWAHIAGTFGALNSRTGWVNAVAGTTETTAVVGALAANTITIGTRYNAGALGIYANADLFMVGVWDVVLGAADIAALAKGFAPSFIRPQNLIFNAPLIRDLMDYSKSGTALTAVNGPTVSNSFRQIVSQ